MKKMVLISIVAIILIIILLIGFGSLRFNSMVQTEITSISKQSSQGENVIKREDLDSLPELLQNYLVKVNVVGKPISSHISLKQKGKIRRYPEQKWLSFEAIQYMSASQLGFIWKAKSFPMFVRDKFISGKGEMMVNLLGIKNMEVAIGSKIDQGSLTRYLAELPIYPIALLDKRIKWEVAGDNALKGTIQANNVIADGIFYFDKNGLVKSFQTKRYMIDSLEDFTGIFQNYQDLQGLKIPIELTAVWNLNEGDYEYFNARIINYSIENKSSI